MGPVVLLLPALWGGGTAQEPDMPAPPGPASPSPAPKASRSPTPPRSGLQTPHLGRNPPPVQATATGKGGPASRSCFPAGQGGHTGGGRSPQVPGPRAHQAWDVRLWESALCLAAASPPQAPPAAAPDSRGRAALCTAPHRTACPHLIPPSTPHRGRDCSDRGCPAPSQGCLLAAVPWSPGPPH